MPRHYYWRGPDCRRPGPFLTTDDTALCARILILAGRAGDPFSRAEAGALFDINDAAGERLDRGRFDDLLAKAVVHHVMVACGYDVPGRDIALGPSTELNGWASEIEINEEVNKPRPRYSLQRGAIMKKIDSDNATL
jgi:hypothetical protein